MLDAGEVLNDEEAAGFWTDVEQHVQRDPPRDLSEDGVLDRADVQCGAAAVLLTLAASWVDNQAGVKEFCLQALAQPFIEPPATHMLDSPMALTDITWDGFAAIAIPALWRRAPGNGELRQMAVRLAIHPHLGAVRRLYAAVEQYPELADDVRRLEVVALYWSRFISWQHARRHREQRAEFSPGGGQAAPDLPDLGEPTKRILDAFVDGTLTLEAPSLAEFIESTPDGLIPGRASGMTRITYALSVSHLVAAWNHLLTLSDGLGVEERERRLAIAAQFASVFSSALTPGSDGSVDGTPSEEERTLYSSLASMTVSADPASARRIWEPILTAGAPAHYWVDNFIDDIWLAGLARDDTPAGFVALIKAMMIFVKDETSWKGGFRDSLEARPALREPLRLSADGGPASAAPRRASARVVRACRREHALGLCSAPNCLVPWGVGLRRSRRHGARMASRA